jgi:hypothetical protein
MVHTGSARIPILAEAANWRGGTHCHDGGNQINGQQSDWQMIGLPHNLAAGRIRKEIGDHVRDMHPKPNEDLKKKHNESPHRVGQTPKIPVQNRSFGKHSQQKELPTVQHPLHILAAEPNHRKEWRQTLRDGRG